MTSVESPLTLAALSPQIGARIGGLDPATALSDEATAQLWDALLKYEVLFIEGSRLTPVQLRQFAQQFGELHVHPIRPNVPGVRDILILEDLPDSEGDKTCWRADVTFVECPPRASVLYAHAVPPQGGDTIWMSTRAAFEALSPPIKKFLATLEAEHDFANSFSAERVESIDALKERYAWQRLRSEYPPVTHPVIRRHAETGQDGIFVNSAFTTRIAELNSEESETVLKLLREHMQKPEFLVRWHWKQGDIAISDNRVTQHYTLNDYRPHHRVMYRATIL